MTRKEPELLLARYLEGQLSGADEAALLELLRQDPQAADELEAYLRLDEGMREAMVPEASESGLGRAVAERLREDGRTDHFARAVVERLQSEEEKTDKPGTRRFRRTHRRRGASPDPGSWGAALFAAAALFMLLILATVSGGGKGKPPVPDSSAARPRTEEPAPPPIAEDRQVRDIPDPRGARAEERQRRILDELAKIEGEEDEARRKVEAAAEAKQAELRQKAQDLADAAARYRKMLSEPSIEPPKEEPAAAPKAPTPSTQAAVAVLERVEGNVAVVSDGARTGARTGMDILPGQGLDVSGAAVLVYRDRTRLQLSAGTELREIVEAKGKRLTVARGVVTADVVRQPQGLPMVFSTPHGEATVLGTTLRLAVDAASTRLDVKEGKVRLTPRDGKPAEVATGHFAVAAVGIDAVAKAHPIDEVLLSASQGFLSGGDWRRVPDVRAFGKVAVEAPQVWNGGTTPGPARLEKRRLGYIRLEFQADADKDYHVWVRGCRMMKGSPEGSGNEWYRFDHVGLEFVDGDATSKHLPIYDKRAYSFNGFGQRDGYWWLSGNADPFDVTGPGPVPDLVPVTVRFKRTGPQVVYVYPIETPLRIDAVWLSAAQKTRPADEQRAPEPPRK